ncbi:hypothetical protein JIN85_06280 [Luteolibacter pohnpeiensis]|uniref:Lipoprotein n=1 Tax=Luteolibacter pohnpeiensis TaxID=454153 RepID=A0A934S6D5_9BACT|nr:hypothetical protein [Luteolibacter pohnpeiensis]MBK1882014.1 hypothetical protein [Luteolibacter pohnpeiensis]
MKISPLILVFLSVFMLSCSLMQGDLIYSKSKYYTWNGFVSDSTKVRYGKVINLKEFPEGLSDRQCRNITINEVLLVRRKEDGFHLFQVSEEKIGEGISIKGKLDFGKLVGERIDPESKLHQFLVVSD